jgi:hypothetical protein
MFRIPPPPRSVRHTCFRSTGRTSHRMGQVQTKCSQPTPIQTQNIITEQGHQNSCATTKTPACLPARTPFFFYIVLAYIHSTPDPSSSAMATRCIHGRCRVAPRLIKLPPVPITIQSTPSVRKYKMF